MKLFIRQS